MKDCLSFDISNNKVMLAYACLLCQLGRSAEASVLFKSLLSKGFEVIKVQVLLSIAYQMAHDELTSQKYQAISCITFMRQQGKIPQAGKGKDSPPRASVVMKRLAESALNQSTTSDFVQSTQDSQNEVPS